MSAASEPSLAQQRLNAFYVLGVKPGAPRAEVEREGQKLLAMLQLGLAEAARYDTPLGPQPRDAETVRAALALLRDPETRLLQTLWAALPPAAPAPEPRREAPAWTGALERMGWGSSR